MFTKTTIAREKEMTCSHSKEDVDQAAGKAHVREKVILRKRWEKVVLGNRLLGGCAIVSLTSHLELQSAL